MRKIIFIAMLACLSGISACSVQKKTAQPQLNLPEQMIPGMEQDTLCLADISWVKVWGDTVLLDIIDKTLKYNKDILIATARITEFEKRHRIARSSQFPSVGAEAYLERETNQGYGNNAVEDYEMAAKLSLSWEIDFFGRLRWANREAKYNYLQTIEAQRALQMTLIAEVATAYFELIALDKELQIVQNTLETRKENVHKAKLRFEGGLTSEIPYQQAQVELAKTASLVPDLRLKIKVKENEISFLSGNYPSTVERSSQYSSFMPDNIRHLGLPSDLIQRRPDVREAELAFNSAAANAGVQWADRFPRFIIGIEGGFEDYDFKGFFSAPLTYMISELTSPIFSFGKKKAQYEASLATCQAKCHAYEEKVLQAFHEVSDAMEGYRSAVENTHLMDDLKVASKKYVDLAMFQYLNGHISYMDVLDAQRSYFNAEIEQSNAIRDQYLALINLYKALGGGWK